MTALVEKIASQGGATPQKLREAVAKPKSGRPKHYVFAYRPTTKQFNLKLSFAKARVHRDEIIGALEAIIRELRRGLGGGPLDARLAPARHSDRPRPKPILIPAPRLRRFPITRRTNRPAFLRRRRGGHVLEPIPFRVVETAFLDGRGPRLIRGARQPRRGTEQAAARVVRVRWPGPANAADT